MQQDADRAQFFRHAFDQVFNSGDPVSADALISRQAGIVGIGTDPREWWIDRAVIDALHAQAPEMYAAGLRFEPGELLAYSEGSVGWIADRPTLTTPDGGRIPMRLTVVCHREHDAWKMVQFHLSIGVGNEDAIGEQLTV